VRCRRRAGVSRAVAAGAVLTAADLGVDLGSRATFVQFSSEVCAPCRATRRVLRELVAGLRGVVHVELDAAQRLDLAATLNVVRTPTVLVLDGSGRVVRRSSGAVTAPQARTVLDGLLDGEAAA